jgi:diketogulonate reductase-like aldo/keto reductase
VEAALRTGYRHIDAAACYGNEAEVGAGIRASGVPREDIFLTSKLWNTFHAADDVERGIDRSLRDLGVDYLDLYLVHWPVSFAKRADNEDDFFPVDPATGGIHTTDVPIEETWRAMEALVHKGKARSIGVSNFTTARVEALLETASIPPAANQVEAHPYLQQPALLAWHQARGIVVQAYSPLGNNIYGRPRAVDDPVVAEVAATLDPPRSPAQVLVQWAVQRGTVVLPKSVTPARIASNFEDFTLPEEACRRIDALDRGERYNFPLRLGLDIFGEHDAETLRKGKQAWIDGQKKLKEEAKAA